MQRAIKRTFPSANWKIVKFANLALFEKAVPELGPPHAYNTALMEGALPDLKKHLPLTNFSPSLRDSQLMRRLIAFRTLRYMSLGVGEHGGQTTGKQQEAIGYCQRALTEGHAVPAKALWQGDPHYFEAPDAKVKGQLIREWWPDLFWLQSVLVEWMQQESYDPSAHRGVALKGKLALSPSWAQRPRQVRRLCTTPLLKRSHTEEKDAQKRPPNEGSVVLMQKDSSVIRISAVLEIVWDNDKEILVFGRQLQEQPSSSNVGDLHFLDAGEGKHLMRSNPLLTDPVERTAESNRCKGQFCIRRARDISLDTDVHIIPHFKVRGAFWYFKHRKVV